MLKSVWVQPDLFCQPGVKLAEVAHSSLPDLAGFGQCFQQAWQLGVPQHLQKD